VRDVNRIREGGFAEIFRVGKEDKIFFKDRKDLIGAKIRLNKIFKRAGPWLSATVVLLFKDIPLNGINLKQGGHLCLRKVFLKSFSLN
jgi:hypothetical protein